MLEQISAERQKIQSQVQTALKSQRVRKKSIDDFPQVESFLSLKYPQVSLRHIPIYLMPAKVLREAGFRGANGCYIPFMDCILVARDANVAVAAEDRFFKTLFKQINAKIDVDDVVVHELMHAVSKHIERPNREYSISEEEFVFTNCIEYYRLKGMKSDDIINTILMAFCVNNILSTKKHLSAIFEKLKKDKHLEVVPWEINYTPKELEIFRNRWAEPLSAYIIDEAISKAKHIMSAFDNVRSLSGCCDNTELSKNTNSRFEMLDI